MYNNPLHITIFPSHYDGSGSGAPRPAPLRTPLQFSLLLSSTLDVFEARARHAAAVSGPGTLLSGDYGLLHAVDERLAAYGFETNTGVKFVAIVDMRGRSATAAASSSARGRASGLGSPGAGGIGLGIGGGVVGGGVAGTGAAAAGAGIGGVGLRDGELKPIFRAMQTAYVRLLQNPFYDPDEHAPLGGRGGRKITSRRFSDEMRRIGEAWAPGVAIL
ncbi:hypothetical protein SLS62_003181 [Diatrype stigma]|uniref:Longin-like protein n=1 Tax=Diatrype stigma TaxID=117547 RepID=A0AAN9UX84_9PEZI